MGLPWVRLDANIASHDKVLGLISDPSIKKWQANSLYFFALGWSGGHGTDGFVPRTALSTLHGDATTARLLVKYGLWDEGVAGWNIRNYAERQQVNRVTEAKRDAQSEGARKANCRRHHGAECGCWQRPRDVS